MSNIGIYTILIHILKKYTSSTYSYNFHGQLFLCRLLCCPPLEPRCFFWSWELPDPIRFILDEFAAGLTEGTLLCTTAVVVVGTCGGAGVPILPAPLFVPLFSGRLLRGAPIEDIDAITWFGSLMFNCSLKTMQNSPIFCKSPHLDVYRVRQFLHSETYPLVRRTMSPGTSSCPASSHTLALMQALWSATLNVRTSRFSFVRVGCPTSNTINTTLIFFSPGLMSLICT